jgi:hypothetical protein
MQKQAQREDDLEQGAALLANLYFTHKNMKTLLEKQSSRIDFSMGEDRSTGPSPSDEQAKLLRAVMVKKKENWWKSLDRIFQYSNYVDGHENSRQLLLSIR